MPAAFQFQALVVFSRNAIVYTAPAVPMQGMEITRSWAFVVLCPFVHHFEAGDAAEVALSCEVREPGHV